MAGPQTEGRLGSVPITQWIGSAPQQDKKSGQSPGQNADQPAGRSDLGGRSCDRGRPQPLINSAASGTWGNRRHFAANNRVCTGTADRPRPGDSTFPSFGDLPMRFRSFVVALLALAGTVLPARADTPKAGEPTLVIRLKSLDGIISDAKYLAGLAGKAEKAAEADAAIQALAGPKGLAGTGLDTTRPIAIYAIVGGGGLDSKGVVMLPVANEKAFIDMLSDIVGRFGVTGKKDDEGVHSFAIPGAPVQVFIRFANKYAYVAAGLDRSAIDPGNLLSPTSKSLTATSGELIGLTFNVDRIPDMLKQIALQQMEVQLAAAKDKKEPNETSAQAAFKTAVLDLVAQRVKMFLTQAGPVDVKFVIDRAAGDISLQATVAGKPGTEFAKEIAATGNRPTAFGGINADALKAALSLAVPEVLRQSLSAVVDEGIEQAIQKENNPAKKDMMRAVLTALAPTLKAGVLDATAGVTGPNASGHFTAFAAVQIKDAKKLENVLKDLSKQVPAKEREALTLNAETIGGVSVHKVVPGPHLDAHARQLFGDQAAVLVAFRPDAAFIVFGDPGATATMKSLIESKTGKADGQVDVQ